MMVNLIREGFHGFEARFYALNEKIVFLGAFLFSFIFFRSAVFLSHINLLFTHFPASLYGTSPKRKGKMSEDKYD